MANTVIGASVEVDFKSVGNLKKELRAATNELVSINEKFGSTSKEATAAAQRVAKLKDAIGDAKSLADAFNPDARFKAFSQTLTAVAGGFSAVQGAVGLLGNESEDLQKTLLKVQSALAISQGLEQIGDLGQAFNNLKAVAVNAFNGIKAAIGSTGIGLLVIALGTVVAYWDDIKEAVTGVSEEQRKQSEELKKTIEIEDKKLARLEKQNETLKAQGLSDKEILNLKIEQVRKIIDAREQSLKLAKEQRDAQIAQSKRYNEILVQVTRVALEINTAVLRAIAVPLQLVVNAVNGISQTLGFGKVAAIDFQSQISRINQNTAEYIGKFVFDPKKTQTDIDKNIEELENGLIDAKEKYFTYNKQITEGNAAASKKISDERMNAEKELTKFIEDENAKRLTSSMTATEKELFEIRKLYDEKIALAKKYNLETDQLEALRLAAISEVINKEFSTRETGGKLKSELIVKEQKEELDNFKAQAPKLGMVQREITQTEQQESNNRIIIAEFEKTQKENIRLAEIELLGQFGNFLSQIAGKNKALAIAGVVAEQAAAVGRIISNTGVANAKAVAASPLTFGQPFVTINSISAGLSIASSIASAVKAINQIKSNSLSPNKGSVPNPQTGGNTNAPLSPALSSAVQGQALNAEAINNLGNQAVRAYVMNSDIQNNQQRNAYLQRNARIG